MVNALHIEISPPTIQMINADADEPILTNTTAGFKNIPVPITNPITYAIPSRNPRFLLTFLLPDALIIPLLLYYQF